MSALLENKETLENKCRFPNGGQNGLGKEVRGSVMSTEIKSCTEPVCLYTHKEATIHKLVIK